MKICFEIGLLLFLLIFNFACLEADSDKSAAQSETKPSQRFAKKRQQMVASQIKRRGIRDQRVLEAMRKVERHKFVPDPLQHKAYDDRPLPIGLGQTISQPYIVAFMTEQLQLRGSEKVLEIGTGSGYQAAILGEIAEQVFTIEIVEELARRSSALLKQLGYRNITVRAGDGYQGWPEEAPFDAIIVTAAPDHIPRPLIDQLKPGGRLIIPVGGFSQDLILMTKQENNEIQKKRVLPVRFVPMTGEAENRRK